MRTCHAHIDVLTTDGPFPTSGSVVATMPDTWWNGSHTLSWVQLTDPSGNSIYYYRDGSVSISPGATGPARHTLSLMPNDLTVSGSGDKMTVPVLTALSAAAVPVHPGETIKIHHEAIETSGSLTSVRLVFHDKYQISRTLAVGTTGPLPVTGSVDQVIPAT